MLILDRITYLIGQQCVRYRSDRNPFIEELGEIGWFFSKYRVHILYIIYTRK